MTTRTSTTLRFAMLLTLANGFLDAHTYLARGGVFANVQTGNVIFFAIDIAGHNPSHAWPHLWPIFAFLAGIAVSSYIKSGRVTRVKNPLAWTMGVQAAVLAVVGFVPTSVPYYVVTIPISFMAAMQIGLFRNIGDLTYIAVATTGNLMRFMEAGFDRIVEKDKSAQLAFRTYGTLIVTFTAGAAIGAFTTNAWGHKAIFLPAAFLAVTLVLFVIDERRGLDP